MQVLFVVWIVAGASSGSGPEDCEGLGRELCNDASDVRTGIGVVLIVVMWLVVDFFLAVIYGVYRLAKWT